MPTANNEEMIKEATSHFREGFLCVESVLMTFAKYNGIRSEIIPKIATGFGAGIGRRGSLCGALTGAVMALGLRYGRNKADDDEAYEKCMNKSFECYMQFKKEFGSVFCNELTECDFTTTEGLIKWRELGLKEKKCLKYVEGSMRILLNLTK
jgi:C_GCAxxG_C_C family probable redox protein